MLDNWEEEQYHKGMTTWKLPAACNKNLLCYKAELCELCNKAKKAYEKAKEGKKK